MLRNERVGDRFFASLELDDEARDPEEAVLGFSQLVDALSAEAKEIWDGCDDRCLNLGIQAGEGPRSAEYVLAPTAITALAAMNAHFAVTIYGADPD